jgi:hypothetical protein
MPMQKGTSPILGKLLKAHARDETEYGQDFARLPGGIHGGIAELVDARLGEFKQGPNQGRPFLYLAGTVVSPATATETVKAFENGAVKLVRVKEVPVQGLRTALTLPLCDTKTRAGDATSADENVADALNELRKLGGPDFTEDIESEDDLKSKLEALKEARVRFRFGTSSADPTAQYPTPRVWERWFGTKGVEAAVNGQVEDLVDDQTKEADEEKEEEPESETESSDDLDALAEAADGGDKDAARKLKALAKDAGASDEDIDSADDWAAVRALIGLPGSTEMDEEKEEGEEEAFLPKKGEVYSYRPLDPKTKKQVKKGFEVEVIAVDKKAETVDLVNLTNRKLSYKKVAWDKLESAE